MLIINFSYKNKFTNLKITGSLVLNSFIAIVFASKNLQNLLICFAPKYKIYLHFSHSLEKE